MARQAASCDTMVVVRPGSVLFAKNSDRDANEAQHLDWQPARTYPRGASVRCTWIEIDQAAETHEVLLSRPFWMWGAEMGANAHGVVIGNEAVFTREPYAKTGLTGMDLLRLALERAATAKDAVEVMIGLLERYGQGGGCGHERRSFIYHNSFIAADPHEAYVLETAGRLWATEQVTVGARSISNGLTIGEFADRHRDRLKTAVAACRIRQPFTQQRAARAEGPADLMAVLRSHGGDGLPSYSPVNGGMAATCMHAGGLAANSQTTASWVGELRPGQARHWVTATAAPCTSLFKPVTVGEPADIGPPPGDVFDPACLWWRHERLHRRVMADPRRLFPLFTAERDRAEAAWLAAPPAPAEAFAEADRLLARWTEAVTAAGPRRDRRPPWATRYWRVRNKRAMLPS